MAKHYRNPKPSLDIDYVTGWNARFYKGRKDGSHAGKKDEPNNRGNAKNKVLKPDPIDPEDEFMVETDPAIKPADEATINDILDANPGDWIDQIKPPEERDEDFSYGEILDAIYEGEYELPESKNYARSFRKMEAEFRAYGLPRAITRNMMYEIGLKTGVDYTIDNSTKRMVFDDDYLNMTVLAAYEIQLSSYLETGERYMSPADLVEFVSGSYLNATTKSTDYEIFRQICMEDFGIKEEYNDNGNPIGNFKDFEWAFKRNFIDLYKSMDGLEIDTLLNDTPERTELLLAIEKDLEKRGIQRERARLKQNAKNRAFTRYKAMYGDNIELSRADSFKTMERRYQEEHNGASLYEEELWSDAGWVAVM